MHEQHNANGQDEAQRFAEAIAIANVPTLLMVLVQLTGDLRWLEEPYRPSRARGMGDNDTGGLPSVPQRHLLRDDARGQFRRLHCRAALGVDRTWFVFNTAPARL
jgi:4-hydroxyacetophenone monooxygenase